MNPAQPLRLFPRAVQRKADPIRTRSAVVSESVALAGSCRGARLVLEVVQQGLCSSAQGHGFRPAGRNQQTVALSLRRWNATHTIHADCRRSRQSCRRNAQTRGLQKHCRVFCLHHDLGTHAQLFCVLLDQGTWVIPGRKQCQRLLQELAPRNPAASAEG